MRKWSKAPRVASVAVLGVLAFSLAACGEEEQVYCTDENDVVVDPDECERRGGGGFFFYHGSSLPANASPGAKLSGGTRAPYNQPGIRSKLGLPKTGSIASKGGFGTSVKTGGGLGGGFGGKSSFGG